MKLYDKKNTKIIAIKTAIGLGVGLAIRLGTMFLRDPLIREMGIRGASAASAYGGGGTGELAYQAVDAVLGRVIVAGGNGNGNGVNIPNPLIGGA